MEWLPTPVFLLGELYGQKSLAGYSWWDHKELDTTKQLTHTHTHTHTHGPFKFRLWAKSGFHSSAQGSPLWQHPVPGTPGILLELLKINQSLIAYNSSNPEGNQSASMKSSDPLCHTSTKHFKVLSYASPHLQLSTVWSRESGQELLSPWCKRETESHFK